MKTNKKYGRLNNNNLEYAPTYFEIENGIMLNPPKSVYLSNGWYEIIDNKPEAETGCYVKFNEYIKDDVNKTITLSYAQIMIPVTREVHKYSKLRLETAFFNIGKCQQFDDFLDQIQLSNDFGQFAPLRKFYDQANELADDNDLFYTYYNKAKEFISLDDETAQQVLDYALITE